MSMAPSTVAESTGIMWQKSAMPCHIKQAFPSKSIGQSIHKGVNFTP
jgi:hypothetical protein